MILSNKETLGLKGLAIILIVLHNVVHLICPIAENEFVFNHQNLEGLIESLSTMPFEAMLSFLGWIGVSVFVFISGYGLTAKYGAGPLQPSATLWICRHYRKLFLLLLPAFVGFLLLTRPWNAPVSFGPVEILLEQCLMLNIVGPERIIPGVYWYLGMALQLYLCFIVMRRIGSGWLLAIGAACAAALALSNEPTVVYLRHNCVGWMMEFVAGIVYARMKPIATPPWTRLLIAIVALAALAVCQLSAYTFALSGVCFVGCVLTAKGLMRRSRILTWLGGLSAAIYVVHPVVRSAWLTVVEKFVLPIGAIGSAAIVLLISVVGAMIYRYWIDFTTRRH